jgi:hypothetical protein
MTQFGKRSIVNPATGTEIAIVREHAADHLGATLPHPPQYSRAFR